VLVYLGLRDEEEEEGLKRGGVAGQIRGGGEASFHVLHWDDTLTGSYLLKSLLGAVGLNNLGGPDCGSWKKKRKLWT
jgi:hypothetical protein